MPIDEPSSATPQGVVGANPAIAVAPVSLRDGGSLPIAAASGEQAHARGAALEGPGAGTESRVAAVGSRLASTLAALLDALPNAPHGPVALAKLLKLDKVLTSRLLKALRGRDPLAVVHLMPGPEPLRRLVRAALRAGVDAALVQDADGAVGAFEELIRTEAGDRSGLDAILSAWLPEARQEFELRRKQAVFRAMSQLKGIAGEVSLASAILHPSAVPGRLDVVWLFGCLGLQRLRPGVPVKFASRRVAGTAGAQRTPRTLAGDPVDAATGFDGLRLDAYCSTPAPRLEVHRAGETMHYTLADHGFGPRSAVDLVFAEVNHDEIDAYAVEPGRRTFFFAEVPIPVSRLVFDVILHESIFVGQEPTLTIYDTVLEGIASVNDRARDLDRLETAETIQSLGSGLRRFRCSDLPEYGTLLQEVCTRLDWNGAEFRGFRCRIDYPVYGSQVTMSLEPPPRP